MHESREGCEILLRIHLGDWEGCAMARGGESYLSKGSRIRFLHFSCLLSNQTVVEALLSFDSIHRKFAMAYSSDRSGRIYDRGEQRERMRPSETRSHVSYADQPGTTRERNEKSYISTSTRERGSYDNGDDSRFSTAQTVIDRDSEYVRAAPKGSVDRDWVALPPRQRGPIPRIDPLDSLDTFQAWILACEYDLHPEIASPFNPIPKPLDAQTKIKVAVTQQSLSQETIKDDVRDLNRDMLLSQKLLKLAAEELQQVESLLEQKNASEADSQYEWVVAQLNWFTSSSVFDGRAPKRRDSTMLYLKRTPKPHVNRAELQRQKNPTVESVTPRANLSYGGFELPRPATVVEGSEDEQDEPEPVKKNSDYLEAWVLVDHKRRKVPLTANTLPRAFPQFMSQDDLNEAVSDVATNGKSIGKRMLRFKKPILAGVAHLISWKRKSEIDSNYEWLLAEIEGAENDSDDDESGSDHESDHHRKHGPRKQSATVYLRRALKSVPVTQTGFEDVKQPKPPATTQDAQKSNTKEPSNLPPAASNNGDFEEPIGEQDQLPISPQNDDGRDTTLSRQSTYQQLPGPSTTAPAAKTHSTTTSPIATRSSLRSRSNSDNISQYQPSVAETHYSAPKPPTVHIAVASQEPTVYASGNEVVPPTNGGIRQRAGFAQNEPQQLQRRESDVGLPVTNLNPHTNGSRRTNGRARSTRNTGRATITRLFGSRSSLFQRTKRGRRGGDSDDENGPSPTPLPNPNPSSSPKTSRWTKACLLIFTLLLSSAFFIGGVSFDRTLTASSLPSTSNSDSPFPSSSVDFLEVLVGCIWHLLSVFFSYCALIWHRRKHSPSTITHPTNPSYSTHSNHPAKFPTINSLLGIQTILLLACTSGPITTGVWFHSVAYCKLTSLLGNALLAFANLAMIFLEESAEQKVVRRDKDIFMLQGIVVGRQNGEVMNRTPINGMKSEDSGIGQSLQMTSATTRVGSSNGESQCGGEV